jgi:acetyl-CoA C-acetyltransferase
MTLDPNLPVLVGVGEAVRRPGDDGPTEPAALMAEAVRAALADAAPAAGADALLGRADLLGAVPSAAWIDGDPGRRVAELLGLDGIATARSSMQGGNGPQLMVDVVAARIQAGQLDAAIVCGAEALSTVARLMKQGEQPDWPAADPARRADHVLEEDRPAATDGESAVGMIAPIMAYPLIENAIGAAAGRTPLQQLSRAAALWSRFSEVAVGQPAAWAPQSYSAEQLRTATPDNRRVTLPYNKLLNANIQVDQGAALLLCSAAAAQALGVPRDRWVFLHAGAHANDEWFLSERRELHRSPAIRACGEAIFAHAGIGADELGPVDLYSCFPAAVQLAAGELGLPLDDPGRPLTCTGGLTFFGGPGNGYALHGIAAVARQLREAPEGTTGLSTALGWYATKHALGLYGNRPPGQPFAALEPAPDAPPPRTVLGAEAAAGRPATAETCTLIYGRDGAPAYGILFALTADGDRVLAKSDDPAVMAAMGVSDFLGSSVTARADRSFDLV